jgi:hypothetical protein
MFHLSTKTMNKIIITLSVLIVIFIAVDVYLLLGNTSSRVQNAVNEEQATSVPDFIIEKANQIIISRTGREFFEKNIKFSAERSRKNLPNTSCIQNPDSCATFLQKTNYLIEYDFQVPGLNSVSTIMEVAVDENGNFISEREPDGELPIPNCVANQRECEFTIDREKAITIAQNAGLKEGIKAWQITFGWNANKHTFDWSIMNTTTENKENCSAGGSSLSIDANDGKILSQSGWTSIC